MDVPAFILGTRTMDMDDLVVLNPALNFESYGVVVLLIELILESLAELLDAILDKFGVSA
jgi:hypothetical protein